MNFRLGDPVRLKLTLCLLLFCATLVNGQESSNPMRKGTTELTIYATGGSGLFDRTNHQFFWVGGRYGKVISHEIGPGFLRGNLQYTADIIPFVAVLQPVNAYGIGINPAMTKWNFKGNSKVKPYFEVGGGFLITNNNVPFNTHNVNFTPQAGFGFHILRGDKRALTTSIKYLHLSNSGLARRNAGINTSLIMTVGYTWLKHK